MRALEECLIDASYLFDEIQRRDDEAEVCRRKEYAAAVIIQRHIRGFLDRAHVRHLNEAALYIQRHWRGYKGREEYMKILQQRVDEMRRARYAHLATCIQKLWRGYLVRSRVFNYRVFKARVLEVLRESEELLNSMKESRKELEILTMNALELDAKLWVRFVVFKTHHLIRTTTRPGIYSKPSSTELSDLERLMRGLKYTTYTKVLRERRKRARNKTVAFLPPELRNLYWQKMKRMHAIINVDQSTLDEQRPRKKFVRMKFPHVSYKYDRSLQNAEPFRTPEYPFRQTDSSKNIAKKKFDNITKSINVFDEKHCVFDSPYCTLFCSPQVLTKLLTTHEK